MSAGTDVGGTENSPIVIQTLAERIYDLVRERIIAGKVSSDDPIRQDALARELGVSKIPLREALARLEQDGLVSSQANRGFFVRPLRLAEAEEIFALRLKIEPEAVGLAATRASDAHKKVAITALDAMDRTILDPSTGDIGLLNREFHLALVRPCGMPVTIGLVERLQLIAERYARKHLEPVGRDGRAKEEHRALLDAWLIGDAKLAQHLAEEHIRVTLNDLRHQFR